MTTETAMLNVRMGREVRDGGNAVLAELGIKPSQYARAVWERLLEDKRQVANEVAAVMSPTHAIEEQEEANRKMAALKHGSRILRDFATQMDLDPATFVPMTAEELDEVRYQESADKYGA